jgi:hypothetical protein
MTTLDTEYCIKVMQAYLEGQAIENRNLSSGQWYEIGIPSWNWSYIEYRIKPEVLKYRRALCRDGSSLYVSNSYHEHGVQLIEKHPHFIRWIDNNWIEATA